MHVIIGSGGAMIILPYPNFVERFDGAELVAWEDVPEIYQKKILEGTMTDEDWNADWEYVDYKPIVDVVSEMLNDPKTIRTEDSITFPVAKLSHVHIFRKEYPRCVLRGCNASNPGVV
jgi:hypothetical protein